MLLLPLLGAGVEQHLGHLLRVKVVLREPRREAAAARDNVGDVGLARKAIRALEPRNQKNISFFVKTVDRTTFRYQKTLKLFIPKDFDKMVQKCGDYKWDVLILAK